jgi:signal transduction histidine kinase
MDNLGNPSGVWTRVQLLCEGLIRITAEHDLDRVLQEIADSAREVIGARFAAIGIQAGESDRFAIFITSGLTPEQRERIGPTPHGKGVLGELLTNPRPTRIGNLLEHPRSAGFPEHHPDMRTFLGVPIPGEHRRHSLYLTEKVDGSEFTLEDQAIAEMLAAHASVALQNAQRSAERDRLLDELEGMHHSRERFFASINHELRNAITSVHGWAEVWIRQERETAPRAATEVLECAKRAARLLDDLLDLIRLDVSGMRLVERDADAAEVVQHAVSSLLPEAAEKGVHIEVTGIDGPVPWRTDPDRVHQILANLLTNAVRHTPDHGTVTVSLGGDVESVRVDVADEGEGIETSMQGTIFEAFERGPELVERGTGLGLAVSRSLARRMGGDLEVESESGFGARFILQLPRRGETPDAAHIIGDPTKIAEDPLERAP